MSKVKLTVGFDVYGTLIDPHGLVEKLGDMVGKDALRFSQQWREKQLEYTFRRGLMKQYTDFSVCTAQALDYTCEYLNHWLDDQQKQQLIELYAVLPVFADVVAGLDMVKQSGHAIYAFSNGRSSAVKTVLTNAALVDYFQDIISVDEIKTFKPDAAVYQHFMQRTDACPENCWLVSSNSFDVIGAMAVKMKGVWINRAHKMIFDPWGMQPDYILSSLQQLHGLLD